MANSLSEIQSTLEIHMMDAITAAYDNKDYAEVERLNDAIRTSGIGVADPSSPQGMEAMREILQALGGTAADDAELQEIEQQLEGPRRGTVLEGAEPVPGREMMAKVEDIVELSKRAPAAPGVGGPIGI